VRPIPVCASATTGPGRSGDPGPDEHLAALDGLYRAHIRVEDDEVFPAAGRALPSAELAAVGREMAARRHVPFAASADVGLDESGSRSPL
jgi:hypothetical protein